MSMDVKKALLALLAALGLFFAVMIAIKMAGCGNNHEYFYRSWKVSILFISFMAIVYFAVQKWLQEAVLKKAIIAISAFFFLTGCFAFASPMETQDVFNPNTGNMKLAFCTECERLHRNPFWDVTYTWCPKDGTLLVKDRPIFKEKVGDHTTDSPMLRIWHGGGRAIQVPANKMVTPLSFSLKKGERLLVKASGDVRGWPVTDEVGPEGLGRNPFNDASLICGNSFMALCVQNGKMPMQECGTGCTIEAVEDDTRVSFAPNIYWADANGKFHKELLDRSSGAFLVTYSVL